MGKRWQQLHYSIYLIVPLALLHFSWSQKTIWQEPIWYWLFAFVLLFNRMKGLVTTALKKHARNKNRKHAAQT